MIGLLECFLCLSRDAYMVLITSIVLGRHIVPLKIKAGIMLGWFSLTLYVSRQAIWIEGVFFLFSLLWVDGHVHSFYLIMSSLIELGYLLFSILSCLLYLSY